MFMADACFSLIKLNLFDCDLNVQILSGALQFSSTAKQAMFFS